MKEIGDGKFYLFQSQKQSERCVISSHGGKTLISNSDFRIPEGVTLYFYTDHNHVLKDTGIAKFEEEAAIHSSWTFFNSAAPNWVKKEHELCENYTLTKYQNSERHSWYSKLHRKENKMGETYTLIRNTVSNHGVMGEAREVANTAIRFADCIINLGASVIGLSAPGPLGEVKLAAAFDIVTVRRRVRKWWPTLEDAVNAISREGYKEIHCYFCRGSAQNFKPIPQEP